MDFTPDLSSNKDFYAVKLFNKNQTAPTILTTSEEIKEKFVFSDEKKNTRIILSMLGFRYIKKKTFSITITQEVLDEIIPPIQSIEEDLEFRKKCEEEYQKTKQEILEIMKRNTEKYRDK